ncbi:MAG: hypothetical protein A2381_18450 [Bdellovibrionales bacterium RIFOXYB1_FULL_37_110]|nr:MAG: hypothetical protein A2417_01320 [Bdellovibrionales bacterium RIFOXYC1_FULL_37_79]OFZ59012.1 MAG: hypothetical protein A2381_18450 [Bdellovibrionales bacterium RIFOXYB1_FULL_37_110]OFZ65117.1 MAG: hypothetical protein A2577_04765 [Bdellovibrionales bacterium RIFOXYD1_FULL_36_51]
MKNNITVTIPSLDDEFKILRDEIETIPWYKKQGYQIVLPSSPHFQKYWNNPELIKTINYNELLAIFDKEIYCKDDYTKGYRLLLSKLNIIVEAINHLALLKEKWCFKMFPQYLVRLTQYGPGGFYSYENGTIFIQVNPDGLFTELNPIETIIHEIVHIGIEESIIQKYNLEHWEKERLVDLICQQYLQNFLPNYQLQKNGNKMLDDFFNIPDFTLSLPRIIEKYLIKYPRN